jgi:maltose/maltodextrin transport system substrate-binding protein
MKRILPLLVLVLAASLPAAAGAPSLRHGRLNARAVKEYNIPVRPGYEGRNPFWNGFSKKYIYAPAFDFPMVEGAVSYRYTLTAETGDGQWSFTEKRPDRPLSKVWKEVPPGFVTLTVQGLDRDGRPAGEAQTRRFFRDFPYEGPYPGPVIPYREAALKTMRNVHNAPWIQHWLTHDEPDMSFKHYTYANKMIGGVINVECLVAQNIPQFKDEAVRIAEQAAHFIMGLAQGPDKPLAFLPPTYYKGLIASAKKENQGRTMALDALAVATALLNLYDVCGEKEYYDYALKMAETYRKLQRPDGSYPVKLDYETGESFSGASAMLHPVVRFYTRLERQYGVTQFHHTLELAERWMHDVGLERFDLESQFEDVNIGGIEPYQNLTNCTAAPYATCLLKKEKPSREEIGLALDLIRFSEDQFVHWDVLPDSCGVRAEVVPTVHEQYKYEMGTVSSAGNVANAMLDYWLLSGDDLYYAKAKALIDRITAVQDQRTGRLPSTYKSRSFYKSDQMYDWVNCTYSALQSLLRMAALTEDR